MISMPKPQLRSKDINTRVPDPDGILIGHFMALN